MKYYITARDNFNCLQYFDGAKLVYSPRPKLYVKKPIDAMIAIVERFEIKEITCHEMKEVSADKRIIVKGKL